MIQYLSSHCSPKPLKMVSSLIQSHHTCKKVNNEEKLKHRKGTIRKSWDRSTPFLWPVHSVVIHFIYNKKQFSHAQGFCKHDMFTGLPSFLKPSFKLSFSSRNYLIRDTQTLRSRKHWKCRTHQKKGKETSALTDQYTNISLRCPTNHIRDITLVTLKNP